MSYLLIAKIVGPAALLAGVYFYGVGEGREAERDKLAARIEKARAEEWVKYKERDKIAAATYERAIAIVAGAQGAKPQIIERIVNAPPTECSALPVGALRVRLLNDAIAAGRAADAGAGSAPRRTAERFAAAARDPHQ